MPQLQFSIDWPRLIAGNQRHVIDSLQQAGIDLLVCNNVDNVRYLTGFSLISGPGLVHSNWATIQVDGTLTLWTYGFYVDSTLAAHPWLTDVRPLPASIAEAIAAHAAGTGARRIGFDGYLSYVVGKELEQAIPHAELINADPLLTDARMRKSADELAILERSVAITEQGMRAALDACVEGTMEYEVAAVAEHAMRTAGAEGFPYSAVVSSGENAAVMQELATDKHLRSGEFVMLDLGCLFEGYYSEFARTALVGGVPHTAEQGEAYRAVYDALQAMIAAIKPGITCSDLDTAGRSVLRDAGWGPYEPRYPIGHGIGMTHWEPPLIDAGSTVELAAGMVLAVEPGIHKPGMGGLRLEELVLVTETGSRTLTRTSFDRDLLSA